MRLSLSSTVMDLGVPNKDTDLARGDGGGGVSNRLSCLVESSAAASFEFSQAMKIMRCNKDKLGARIDL